MLQIAFIFFVCAYAMLLAWNMTGAVEMHSLNDNFTIELYSGELEGTYLSPSANSYVKDLIEHHTSTEYRPFRILWHQLWYNWITDGYDQQIWFRPLEELGPLYAIYMRDNLIFLRLEYSGKNRVLRAEFSRDEFERELRQRLQGNQFTR